MLSVHNVNAASIPPVRWTVVVAQREPAAMPVSASKTLSRAAAMASWSRASSATGLKLEMLPAKVRDSPEVPSTVIHL